MQSQRSTRDFSTKHLRVSHCTQINCERTRSINRASTTARVVVAFWSIFRKACISHYFHYFVDAQYGNILSIFPILLYICGEFVVRLKTLSFSLMYSLIQILQGQLVHPYQTMRELVRDKVFIWMSTSPIFLWVFCLLLWRIIAFLLFSVIPYPNFWVFLALWFTLGIAMYQIVLLYLLFRFLRVRI